MKRVQFNIISFAILLFLSSCFREEIAVDAHFAGDIISEQVNLESNYKYQIYYSLREGKIISQNSCTDWDLGFESTKNGYHVILNSSCSMFALNSGKSDFNLSYDTNGVRTIGKPDAPNGSLDSTAIGDWRTSNPVYIIDCGFDENGNKRGFSKIKILNVDNSSYSIRVANLDGTNEQTFQISKDDKYNFQFLSFNNPITFPQIEPPKTDWDIMFSHYTDVFYNFDPPMPYMVVSCLTNRYNTLATKDSLINFDQIDLDFAKKQTLSTAINSIGWDWKYFENNIYTTLPYMNFVIQCQDASYYKMHFVDFYSKTGTKGSPKFEYQKL
ncbi:MAG: HmuY family protein [Chitinophagaceae bacterium]|nr:HmuY family protein [Chitinophagaceae bacterium]HMN33577.1 HmuY family protein [Chitinophagaceae bacterium]